MSTLSWESILSLPLFSGSLHQFCTLFISAREWNVYKCFLNAEGSWMKRNNLDVRKPECENQISSLKWNYGQTTLPGWGQFPHLKNWEFRWNGSKFSSSCKTLYRGLCHPWPLWFCLLFISCPLTPPAVPWTSQAHPRAFALDIPAAWNTLPRHSPCFLFPLFQIFPQWSPSPEASWAIQSKTRTFPPWTCLALFPFLVCFALIIIYIILYILLIYFAHYLFHILKCKLHKGTSFAQRPKFALRPKFQMVPGTE